MLASLIEINTISGVVELCMVVYFVVGGTESNYTNMHFQPHKVKVWCQKYLQADG
jgi:hypothetical protein